jgi:hypothetical protein
VRDKGIANLKFFPDVFFGDVNCCYDTTDFKTKAGATRFSQQRHQRQVFTPTTKLNKLISVVPEIVKVSLSGLWLARNQIISETCDGQEIK